MKGLTLEQAYGIMGKLIIGVDGIDRVFDFIPKRMRLIMCAEKDLEIHADLGHRLYLELSHTNNSQPLNIEMLAKIICRKKGNQIGQDEYLFWRPQFNDDGGIKQEAWFYADRLVRNATPKFGWRIASEDVIPETRGLNYLAQTDALIEYIERIYKNRLPRGYKEAISEWEARRPMLEELLARGNSDALCKEIVKANITSLIRESFVSTEYRRLLIYKNERKKILRLNWNWSNTCDSDGKFVAVGDFDDGGTSVHGRKPDSRHDSIGVSFSRHA